MQNIELVQLSGDCGDKISSFIRQNLVDGGDPLFSALISKMSPEEYEGSQLECTVDFLTSCCTNPTSSIGLTPYSFALVQGGRYIGLSLGTRETFPKEYDYRDQAAVRGRGARSYFHLLNQAHEDIEQKMEGKLNGKQVHVCWVLLVAKEFRNKGIGSFLLTNTIQLAHKDNLDGLLFRAAGDAAKRVATKIKIESQITTEAEPDDILAGIPLNSYLVLFRPLL